MLEVKEIGFMFKVGLSVMFDSEFSGGLIMQVN